VTGTTYLSWFLGAMTTNATTSGQLSISKSPRKLHGLLRKTTSWGS